MSGLQKGKHICKGFKLNFHSFLGCSERVGAEVRCTFLNPVRGPKFGTYSDGGFWDFLLLINILHIQSSALASLPIPSGKEACHFHCRPHGQLILTSVSGLLVLYFPVIFLIPLMPWLKISFFLPMSLLSSRLFCFRFSFPFVFPLCLSLF